MVSSLLQKDGPQLMHNLNALDMCKNLAEPPKACSVFLHFLIVFGFIFVLFLAFFGYFWIVFWYLCTYFCGTF